MADLLSLLVFFIYSLVILAILIYVSPILSALFMIIVPVVIVFIFPSVVIEFFAIKQFSFVDGAVPIYNLHILLFIWSAFIAMIAYAEVLNWYLLREKKPKTPKPEISGVKAEKMSAVNQIKDFLEKLMKILKGEKPKSKP